MTGRLHDRTLSRARALVIDGNALSRTMLATQLRDLGVNEVTPCGRLPDARTQIERQAFDIVLCDYHFDGSDMTGQDLLDELRRERLLPWSTVFIMVTGEATYARVAEAAESVLDGYLIKPYRATALSERIVQARKRKRELAALLQALDRHDWTSALDLASQRLAQRAPYWPYAARLAGELHLVEGNAAAAMQLFETVRQLMDDPPWARLGVARAMLAAGETATARRQLVDLRQREPGFADVCDVLGRIELEAGDSEAALETFRAASSITPGCLVRLQQTGSVAFVCGRADEALDHLERTVSFGLRSKLFDPWTLLLIALLRFDRAEPRALLATTEHLARVAARQNGPDRLRRLWVGAKALQRLLAGDAPAALGLVRDLAADPMHHGLEPSAAYAALAVVSRFPSSVLDDELACIALEPLVLRFCGSRAALLTLSAYARRRPALVELVQRCQREVARQAESAVEHALNGRPARALEELVQAAERTGNRRLTELAFTLWHRHEAALGDAAAGLSLRIDAVAARTEHPGQVMAGERASARTPGGMVLSASKPRQLLAKRASLGVERQPVAALPMMTADVEIVSDPAPGVHG